MFHLQGSPPHRPSLAPLSHWGQEGTSSECLQPGPQFLRTAQNAVHVAPTRARCPCFHWAQRVETNQGDSLRLLVPKSPAGPGALSLSATAPQQEALLPPLTATQRVLLQAASPVSRPREEGIVMISPILQMGSREVRPFPGRACSGQQQICQTKPGPTEGPTPQGAGAWEPGHPGASQAPACCCTSLPGSHPYLPGPAAAWPHPGRCPAQLKVLSGPGWPGSSSGARGSHRSPGTDTAKTCLQK